MFELKLDAQGHWPEIRYWDMDGEMTWHPPTGWEQKAQHFQPGERVYRFGDTWTITLTDEHYVFYIENERGGDSTIKIPRTSQLDESFNHVIQGLKLRAENLRSAVNNRR